MTIGERIKEQRKQKKLTQNELAELSGVAAISIRQYEGGKRQPQVAQLIKLAHALDVPISCFINVSGNDFQNAISNAVDEEIADMNISADMANILKPLFAGAFDLKPSTIDSTEAVVNNINSKLLEYLEVIGKATAAGISPDDLISAVSFMQSVKDKDDAANA